MSNSPLSPKIWAPKTVAETLEIYADWADSYDDDLGHRGYHTPARIAEALAPLVDPGETILDFGCGTGVSGAALQAVGLGPLHGTDISKEMVEHAKAKALYEKLWVSEPGAAPEPYGVIVAAGVVSLGAAPPETLDTLIEAVHPGGLLAFSFNDPTLQDGRYDAQLNAALTDGRVATVSRVHGPHIDDVDMGADVIVLRRT